MSTETEQAGVVGSRPGHRVARPPGGAGVRTIRVGLVAPSLDILGGQAVQAQLLLQHLNQAGGLAVELVPINPRLPGPLRLLQRIRYVRTVVTSARYLLSLVWQLRRYDVVHIFSASYLSFVLAPTPALVMARLLGRPTILNYRSGEADDHLRRWRRSVVPTLRLATRIVTPSRYLVEVFGRHGLAAEPIPNFVDLDRFRFRERSAPRPVFLAIRNFEAHYDVGCTLRAFQRIQARHPTASLWVAGDGPLRRDLETLATALGLRRVEFLGRVDHEHMPDLYDRADIYLNTPRIDNMPNSILEAHAAGLPVVTTDAGGIPYMVRDGETALMVAAGDDAGVADAALRLLEEPHLAARLARNGLDECRARYSWPTVRGQWLDLYDELAGANGAIGWSV
jgi:L-malate glycosyltransferase